MVNLPVLNNAAPVEANATFNPAGMKVRPYQLMCAICSLGGPLPDDGRSVWIDQLLERVKLDPDTPLTIVCNAGDLFAYQDPGTEQDTPEGADYNRKRDLDILQRMNWPPGITLPARVVFMSLFPLKGRPLPIPSAMSICGFGSKDPGWEGCVKTQSGDYEKGLARGVAAIIPARSKVEMAHAKQATLEAMRSADEITMRPHLLLCAVCQLAADIRPPFEPDNLPEFLQMILHERPEAKVRFVPHADAMMCGPCPQRVPGKLGCTNVSGSGGLSNEKRDLDVLAQMGLHFGSVMKVRDLYRLIFERVSSSMSTCSRPGSGPTSVWWDRGCGDPDPRTRHQLFETGRDQLKDRLA